MNRGVVVVVASCMLLAACSSSGTDNGTSTTTAAPPSTTATTTTSKSTTTTVTTASEVTATTVDTDAQLAAAEQAYLDAFDAYIAAARDPSNPDLRAEIERLYTGPSLEFTVNQLDSFVEQNWVARPAEEPSSALILLPPQFVPDRTDFVELVACTINTEQFVEVGGAPDGSDALVTDAVAVNRLLVRLKVVDGQWKADSGETLAELASPGQCAP